MWKTFNENVLSTSTDSNEDVKESERRVAEIDEFNSIHFDFYVHIFKFLYNDIEVYGIGKQND